MIFVLFVLFIAQRTFKYVKMISVVVILRPCALYKYLYFGVMLLSCSYFSLFHRSKGLLSVLIGDFSSLQSSLLSTFLSFSSTPLSFVSVIHVSLQISGLGQSFSILTSPSGPGASRTAVHPASILSFPLSDL